MCCSKNHFWLGMTLGTMLGAWAYRFMQTPKGEQLKHKLMCKYHKLSHHAEDMMDTAKEKMAYAGTQAADKMADMSHNAADKAEDLRDKAHTAASDFKK